MASSTMLMVFALLSFFGCSSALSTVQKKRDSGDIADITSVAEDVGSHHRKALLVDISGPNSSVGEGVREMGMIVDLKAKDCQYDVHVLSICDDCDVENYRWERDVTKSYLHGVKVYNMQTFKEHGAGFDYYDKIIIGGKLNILRDGPSAELIEGVLDELAAGGEKYRSKAWGFWDDVPFVRCTYKDLCPTVPALVAKFTKAVHEFYVLTPGDQSRMVSEMKKNHIEPVPVSIWPMRFTNMVDLAPPVVNFQAFSDHELASKSYLTLLGNYHPVNKLNLQQFFEGSVGTICDAIRTSGSPIKLLIMGGIAEFAANALHKMSGVDTDCLELRSGFVDNEVLERTIWPNTRAVMNPFFFDVESGISVKSFESVKDSMPIVTSFYGLHGIGEIPDCALPVPKDSTPAAFADFVVRYVIPDLPYLQFARMFDHSKCLKAQLEAYPLGDLC